MKLMLGKTQEEIDKLSHGKEVEGVLTIVVMPEGKQTAITTMTDAWKLLVLVKGIERALLEQMK